MIEKTRKDYLKERLFTASNTISKINSRIGTLLFCAISDYAEIDLDTFEEYICELEKFVVDILQSHKVNKLNKSANRWGVPNQFTYEDNEGNQYFQSYETIVVKITPNGKIFLDGKYKYSVTTSKYRSLFLGESTKETDEKIKSGEYQIVNLN